MNLLLHFIYLLCPFTNDKPVWIISYLEIFTPSSNNNNEEPKLDIEETCLSARSGILHHNFYDMHGNQVSKSYTLSAEFPGGDFRGVMVVLGL